MTRTDPPPEAAPDAEPHEAPGEALLELRPELTDHELNELFGAAWPDHRPTSFEPVLARSLAWVAA